MLFLHHLSKGHRHSPSVQVKHLRMIFSLFLLIVHQLHLSALHSQYICNLVIFYHSPVISCLDYRNNLLSKAMTFPVIFQLPFFPTPPCTHVHTPSLSCPMASLFLLRWKSDCITSLFKMLNSFHPPVK